MILAQSAITPGVLFKQVPGMRKESPVPYGFDHSRRLQARIYCGLISGYTTESAVYPG